MPSTRPEDFLSTVRTAATRPGQVLDVVVLTSDAGLLEALRATAGSGHTLWDAPGADAAVDYLVGGRCHILIADLGSLRGDVTGLLERLQSQFPELVLMATGRREEEGMVASLLSSGRIYRFLHKPISPARASQFLNAATRRYNEQRDVTPVALQTVRTIARRRPYLGKVLAAGSGVVAAVIAFAIWQSQERGLPATMQTTQVGDSPLEDRIKAKLGSAQIAYLSGRLLDPRGDNALEYYEDVLAMQADHAEAKAGMQKVIDALEARVTEALQERDPPRVVSAWTALQRAAPDHPRLDVLKGQLLALSRAAPKAPEAGVANTPRARTPAAVRPTVASRSANATMPVETDISERELTEAIAREMAEQEAAVGPPQAEQVAAAPPGPPLAEEIDAIVSLRERGVLIAPAGSNAFDRMIALRQRYPDAQEVRSEQQRLAFVLLDRSRTALAANDVDEAATFIDRANTLIPGMTASRAIQEQLSAAQQQRDFTTNVAQGASLKRTREVPPVYPRDAAREGTEGWVQVEFTIAPDGTTKDLLVRDSEPAAVFDRAAIDSVSKWRFEPVRRNGAPVAQRAVLQVRFVLND